MKMNKILSLLTLTAAAFAGVFRAQADGDIYDIRFVDTADMKFGDRNLMSDKKCSPDHPLVVGETVYVRMRMPVRNCIQVWKLGQEPQTWKWKNVSAGALDVPAIGLRIGTRNVWAEYSATGPDENWWQYSGELEYDDEGNATSAYRYFTDFYFKYTVEPGDMGLPVQLLYSDLSPAGAEISSNEYAIRYVNCLGAGKYRLVGNDGSSDFDASLSRRAEGFDPPPPGDAEKFWYPLADYNLVKEGLYVKTVDFSKADGEGSPWSEASGKPWRMVYPGMSETPGTSPSLEVQGGTKAKTNIVVYVWCDDPNVAEPVGDEIDLVTGDDGVTRKVLTVHIAEGAPGVSFALKGGDGASEGAKTTVCMSATKEPTYYKSGRPATAFVSRPIEIAKAPKPTLQMRFENGEMTHPALVAPIPTESQTSPMQLVFRVVPAASGDVKVRLTASVNNGSSLADLYGDNVLRISPSSVYDPDGQVTEVTIPAGETVVRYVYVLGAREDTEKYGVNFKVEEISAPDDVTIDDYSHTVLIRRAGEDGIKFTKSNPVEGATVEIGKDDTKAFKFQLTDTSRNLKLDNYEFHLENVDTGDDLIITPGIGLKSNWYTFNVKPSDAKDSSGNILLPPSESPYNVEIWAKSPDGGTTTERMAFKIKVSDNKQTVTIDPFDGKTYTIGEGQPLQLRLGLNVPHDGSIDRYVYIEGGTPEDTALIDSSLLTLGARIDRDYQFVTTPQDIRKFLDGNNTHPTVLIKAILANQAANPFDHKTGGKWAEGQLQITVTNNPPLVETLNVAGTPIDDIAEWYGQSLDEPVSMGVPKSFRLTKVTDVAADLKSEGPDAVMVKWVFDGDEDHAIVTNGVDKVIKHTFTKETQDGKKGQRVEVFVKDKDMSDWPTRANFMCYVKVRAKPFVAIVPSLELFNETDTAGSKITVSLSEAPTDEIQVELKLADVPTGYMRLQTIEGTVTNRIDATGNVMSNVYLVTFQKGYDTRTIRVAEMDGTDDTYDGILMNAEVISETLNEDGVAWKDFYSKADSVLAQIKNEPPVAIRPTQADMDFTNENASAGVYFNVKYAAKDVPADMAEPTGIAVTIEVDGTLAFSTNVFDKTVREAPIKFEGEGPHYVIITYTDKDDGSTPCKLNFYVQQSKRLQLRAHGPAGAIGSANGLSSKYGGYPGLGAGRVWAGTGPQSVENFVHTYSFGIAASMVPAYAYGYKVAGGADDGTLDAAKYPGRDRAIDKYGNWFESTPIAPGNFYNYADDSYTETSTHKGVLGLDSFVYGWACDNSGNSGDSGGSQSFVLNIGAVGECSIPLPDAQDTGAGSTIKSIPVQYWEAVFSSERLKGDNCGDINSDGIPDRYVTRYKFDVIDAAGALSGDDLRDLNYTTDENPQPYCVGDDFLPSTERAAYYRLIPGLPATWGGGVAPLGEAFTPILKIRGFGDSYFVDPKTRQERLSNLNDAPEQIGLTDIMPERVYTDPRTDGNSTLSYVEWVAWSEFKAAYEEANGAGTCTVDLWTPENPTDPTLSDSDRDGMTDGYEYWLWYMAHVGWIENYGTDREVHRRLTGRAYDPRNPGEGRLITSEEIEEWFNPNSSSGGQTRDSDNDGLPDILEFLIGTNPVDFDTDGDGLPDGWELAIGGCNPLLTVSYTHGIADGRRNFDGDAMAISSYNLEANVLPQVYNREHAKRWTFAVEDTDGDTDGLQWYATTEEPAIELEPVPGNWWKVTVGTNAYAVVRATEPVRIDGRLATALYAYTIESSGEDLVCGCPNVLSPGIRATVAAGEGTLNKAYLRTATPANACWIYGRGDVNARNGETADSAANYGCLALGRRQDIDPGTTGLRICKIPSDQRDVAFLHYLCYQEFGFDPRTAWNANDPLANRWSAKPGDEGISGVFIVRQGGYTGIPTRTREFTAYDEFLLYSFFLNNAPKDKVAEFMGGEITGYRHDAAPNVLIENWGFYTTNPNGPGEVINGEDSSYETEYYWGRESDRGADTDGDGVPDGWELYVMSGPKALTGDYVFAPPYAGFVTAYSEVHGYHPERSYWSPFVGWAASAETANINYVSLENTVDMTELREFSGSDSCAYYYSIYEDANASASSTILPRDQQDAGDTAKRLGYTVDDSKWLNKFFPTDPWNFDTDGDGVNDGDEGKVFVYKSKLTNNEGPWDDGKLWSVPGAGLNPCSVDTDLDGLPDGWERQYRLVEAAEDDEDSEGAAHVYDNEEKATFVKEGDTKRGNPLEGYDNCMDGTVPDAYTTPNDWTVIMSDGRRWSGHVNRDYDNDGLENWQEYLVGSMRCWRYDDPFSPFDTSRFTREMYCKPEDGKWIFDIDTAVSRFHAAGYLENAPAEDDEEANALAAGEFWHKTLIDKKSPIYNPGLAISESGGSMSPGAQYFSPVTNGWDCAYLGDGLQTDSRTAYYLFYHRIGSDVLAKLWTDEMGLTGKTRPTKYVGCSPLHADTDHDGLDDYYELFHGLNPLLGESGVSESYERPCDVVASSWRDSPFEAWGVGDKANYWQKKPWKEPRGNADPKTGLPMDFEVFPWLNGLQNADPDGDDVRNAEEGIMPTLATATWHHTDPTPLWMTDASYTNSLVSRFFRLPARFEVIALTNAETFVYNDVTNKFCDFPGYAPENSSNPNRFAPFVPDLWNLAAKDKANWICSFEQNEGYDTDHDAIGDQEESSGKYRAATDPLDADSPKRRQAMYFQGKDRPSILQTPPVIREHHPHPSTGAQYPAGISLLTYTVECWVKPESVDPTESHTILERAIWTDASKAGDLELLRCNFQLAVKNGFWYTKYDTSGTEVNNQIEVSSETAATTEWTHLAATYDGERLMLYVNGVAQTPTYSRSQPECGASALSFFHDVYVNGFTHDWTSWGANGGLEWCYDYDYTALLVGASFRGQSEIGKLGREALDLVNGTNTNWTSYRDFFKGYVDEIRVWDGARTESEIIETMRTRFDGKLAAENRSAVYASWNKGERRYAKDATGSDYEVTPELRCHYHFDSVPAGVDEASVAHAPHGFDYFSPAEGDGKPVGGSAYFSRPEGYRVEWLAKAFERYPGTVYNHPAWVMWVPNTVAHLPRYDGTTLDSQFWSADYRGATNGLHESGVYKFANSCEPVSMWTQYARNGVEDNTSYATTSSRHHFLHGELIAADSNSTRWVQFEFTGRNLNQQGDDLIPLGGAYVRYCEEMWDGQGASTVWEIARRDSDNDGMSDKLEEYIRNNFCTDASIDSNDKFNWNTPVDYWGNGILITAGEAYRRELAKGVVETEYGVEQTPFRQVADTNASGIPDWWEDLYNIAGEPGTSDKDNDGLNNRVEYLVSEVYTNFNVRINPVMPVTDGLTNDYFRTVGKLYLGEMFTDYDQVEDHWERKVGDSGFADANAWDALKDVDADGWTNFDESRYNGYTMSTLPQLVSHLIGDAEVMDAPIPTIRLTVRYNGKRKLTGDTEEKPEESSAQGDDSSGGDDNSADINVGNAEAAKLVVQVCSDPDLEEVDASYALQPGKTVSGAVYMGGWENRVVRGTMGPGHIDIGSVNLKFAQVLQSDLYSWTDDGGLHLARPYEEFKAAIEKYPGVVRNVDDFTWWELVKPEGKYTEADRAVTVDRSADLQFGYISVYGQHVGTIDLETGDFEFDMAAVDKLTPNYTFEASKGPASAWSYREAVFKLTYSATVPSVQQKKCQVSLARPDSGFVRGGKNTVVAYYDLAGDGYTPGTDPMGVIRDVDVGWNGADVDLELTTMSAVTPRVDLWTGASDRAARTEASDEKSDSGSGSKEGQEVREGNVSFGTAVAAETRVRVLRYRVDNEEPFKVGVREARVIFDRVFQDDVRSFIHEGDILRDGEYDLDWTNLANDMSGTSAAGIVVTNVDYLIVFGDGKVDYDTVTDTDKTITAHPVLVSRRFERTRTAPTAINENMVCTEARPTFKWRIDNEDIWASRYGTTYTAFQVKVFDVTGKTVIYESGFQRMPAPDENGVYSWTAPLYAGAPSPSGSHLLFANLSNYTWQVFTYNSKFRTDDKGSAKLTFRMNVTTDDESTFEIPVKVAYAGPAKTLTGRVHVQAFSTPDFIGEPVSETVLDKANGDVVVRGLRAGTYFVRAYIDTDRDFKHSDWESWGYLNGRDVACVGGNANIFTPVAVTVGSGIEIKDPRTLYIEDCDTNGNCFPDVWEAEENRGRFDPNRTAPVSGDAELIRINPNLTNKLTRASQFEPIQNALRMLNSVNGVALMTGIAPADVFATAGGFEVKSEVDPETLTIVGFAVDAAQNRVLLKVGAETTANVDAVVANFLNITVRKGAEVTVKVERADSPNGPWSVVPGVGGTVTVDRAGRDIEVKLDGELPAQGYFRAKVEE